MVLKTEYTRIKAYTTKDGSVIRELMHPGVHGYMRQSLAEATVSVGFTTLLHRHHKAEEIYHVTQGIGVMTLGDEQFELKAGDTVCILPGSPHQVQNTGKVELKILCCCSPAYSDNDTELVA